MSQNLKPGDICLVVGSKVNPENIGKVVTLVEYVPTGFRHGRYLPVTEPCWEVTGDNIMALTISGKKVIADFPVLRQVHLIKIGDKDTNLIKKTEKEKPVTA